MRVMYCALILVLGLYGCSSTASKAPNQAGSSKIQERIKPELMEILSSAEKVESFRLDEYDQEKRIAQGKTFDQARAREWAAVLLKEETYLWNILKACKTKYGVLLVFTKGTQRVECSLCFSCDILRLRAVDAQGKTISGFTQDFDPSRAMLVAWAKEALPDDAVIQALK